MSPWALCVTTWRPALVGKASSIVAVGADFERRGNEGRLQFVWPVIDLGDGSRYLAEGSTWAADGSGLHGPLSESTLAERVARFDRPLSIDSPQGLVAMGPDFLANAASLRDPLFDEILVRVPGVRDQAGYLYSVATVETYEDFARALAAHARDVFDESLKAAHAQFLPPRARVALAMFEAEPSLPYEARVIRRLLALRIDKDYERYASVLVTASRRLDATKSDVEERVVSGQEILEEVVPYRLAIDVRTRHKIAMRVFNEAFVNVASDIESSKAVEGLGPDVNAIRATMSGQLDEVNKTTEDEPAMSHEEEL